MPHLFDGGEEVETWVVSSLLLLLGVIYASEQKKNEQRINKIPIRVNVNGIRGKSTTTRLISAILAEQGFVNLGKTTGTAARKFYGLAKTEQEIIRKPSGVNISEQLAVIAEAAANGAESLVCECMAINPLYQKIYQDKMIKANVGVIVNVLEDHLAEMGPTTDQIAQAFTSTIPRNGTLIIPQDAYTDYFTRIAKARNTAVFIADEGEIPPGYLDQFSYYIFPNNVSIPLAFARAMGIPKQVALAGMLKANPDPGALIIDYLEVGGKTCTFVNAFAANDPSSALAIWQALASEGRLDGFGAKPLLIFNCRADRVDRTEQFAASFFRFLETEFDLLVMGNVLGPILKGYSQGTLGKVGRLLNLENQSGVAVRDRLYEIIDDRLVLCLGNIHGEGEVFLAAISEWSSELYRQKANLA